MARELPARSWARPGCDRRRNCPACEGPMHTSYGCPVRRCSSVVSAPPWVFRGYALLVALCNDQILGYGENTYQLHAFSHSGHLHANARIPHHYSNVISCTGSQEQPQNCKQPNSQTNQHCPARQHVLALEG